MDLSDVVRSINIKIEALELVKRGLLVYMGGPQPAVETPRRGRPPKKRRGRPPMTDEQKAALSAAMKRVWKKKAKVSDGKVA